MTLHGIVSTDHTRLSKWRTTSSTSPWYTSSSLPKGFQSERHFYSDNLLVRIYLIIEMILVDRPCAMAV